VALANTGSDNPVFLALNNSATIAIFVTVGAFAWRRDPESGFGRLLVIAGLGWFIVSFGASSSSALYSVGRLTAWAEEALIVDLFLSFPLTRPETTPARVVVAAAVGLVVFLWVPSALLSSQFPTPSPYS